MKIFPLQNKTTFVVTFGDNSLSIYNEMRKRNIPGKVVFLYEKSCKYDIANIDGITAVKLEPVHIFSHIRVIYHMATSRKIIVDNYFAFLSAVSFKEEVECIQVWHAAGAIKKFGLKDNSTQFRNNSSKKRFEKVYKQFHKVVVGSDKMAEIFMAAFNLSDENMLKTGLPRTDIFFDFEKQAEIKNKLISDNNVIGKKKVILYAPTFRDGELSEFDLQLDLDMMYRELKEEYIVLLKLHPAIKNAVKFDEKYPGFVFNYSSYIDINDLLLVTDVLISDYSSVPFEFALLNRPMVFYAYDLEKYQSERGLWEKYEDMIPGPVSVSTSDVIAQIKNNLIDIHEIRSFSTNWNCYSDGQSSSRLVDYLFGYNNVYVQENKTVQTNYREVDGNF